MSEGHEAMPLSNESRPLSENVADGEEPMSKRLCSGTSLRNATRIIKVEVGRDEDTAEWLFHENLLVANSELAKGCLAHNTSETINDTIKLIQGDAASFEVFADYVYKGRMQSTKLNLDQLLKVYILADYLGSPRLADAVFEQIFKHTQAPAFVFTYPQIEYVLSNTLDVQPLRTLLLDQIGCGVILKRYAFSTDPADVLEPYMRELMAAVVKALSTVSIAPMFPIRDTSHYLKHQTTDTVIETPDPEISSPTDDFAKTLGHLQIDYVVAETKASKEWVIAALKTSGGNRSAAIKWLKSNPEVAQGGS